MIKFYCRSGWDRGIFRLPCMYYRTRPMGRFPTAARAKQHQSSLHAPCAARLTNSLLLHANKPNGPSGLHDFVSREIFEIPRKSVVASKSRPFSAPAPVSNTRSSVGLRFQPPMRARMALLKIGGSFDLAAPLLATGSAAQNMLGRSSCGWPPKLTPRKASSRSQTSENCMWRSMQYCTPRSGTAS